MITENTDDLEGKIETFLSSIIEKLNSNDEWKLCLYVVSNENVELKESNENIKRLEEVYGLEVIPIGLAKISQYMSIRPEPINAVLVLDTDAIMSFSEDPIASSKSYVIRLPVNEIIRITCDSESLRNQYNMEDVNELEDVDLDYSVLFDNVRGFVARSKYNQNIATTLKEEPSKLFMYNNGLTLISEDIEALPINAGKRIKLTLTSFQVINGGQTLKNNTRFSQAR
ncbi:MAG: AIPR family protein [Cyanobacteria bacterium J06650_10]